MDAIWIIGIIYTALGVLVLLSQILIGSFNFIRRQLSHPHLIVTSISEPFPNTPVRKSHARLIYSGTNHLIIERTEIKLDLWFANRSEQLFGWLQLAIALFADDADRLRINVFSLDYVEPAPKWCRIPFNILAGISAIGMFISWSLNFIGWIFLVKRPKLNQYFTADDSEISIRCIDDDSGWPRPVLIQPGVSKQLLIRYELSTKKQRGFRLNAATRFVAEIPQKPFWKLSLSSEMVFQGREELLIYFKGKKRPYAVTLNEGYVCVSAQKP